MHILKLKYKKSARAFCIITLVFFTLSLLFNFGVFNNYASAINKCTSGLSQSTIITTETYCVGERSVEGTEDIFFLLYVIIPNKAEGFTVEMKNGDENLEMASFSIYGMTHYCSAMPYAKLESPETGEGLSPIPTTE